MKTKKLIGVAALAVCLLSAFSIVKFMQEYVKQKNDIEMLQELHEKQEKKNEEELIEEPEKNEAELPEQEKGNTAENELSEIVDDVPLEQINLDYIGWIAIDGTRINYPVVQALNNMYYLDHDFYQNKSPYGVPFLNSEADRHSSQNLTVFAQNMSDGQMFTDLLKYEDQAFYDNHSVITFLGNEYQIFAAYRVNLFNDAGLVMAYMAADYYEQEYFIDFMKQVREKSFIESDVDVVENDKILSLSTCTWDEKEDRFVVFAKLLEK